MSPPWLPLTLALAAPLAAQTTYTKADNTTALDQAASWTPSGVPGSADIVSWNGNYTNGAVSVGSGLSVNTLRLASPSTAITLNAGTGGLTIGPGGFDLSAAAQNLTVNAPVTLAADQTWSVASGRTLAFSSSVNASGAAPVLTLVGAGTVGLASLSGASGTRLTLDAPAASLAFTSNTAGFTFVLKSGNITYGAVSGGTDKTNVRVEGGTFAISSSAARYQLASANQTFELTGGTVDVSKVTQFGFRVGGSGSASQAGAQAVIASQSGGTLLATTFNLGGNDTTAVKSPSYTLAGGDFTLGSTSTIAFQLGADTAGAGSSTFNFSGGTLRIPGTITGAQAGARQIFAMDGGMLAVSALNFARLRSSDAAANGSFLQSGGTLAPGDTGVAGRCSVTGTYTLGANATLAFDVGGPAQATAYQTGQYDVLAVAGDASLQGDLSIALLNGYAPAPSDSFTVLTSGGALSGAFKNVAFGDSLPVGDGLSGFTINQSGNSVVATNYHVLQPPVITAQPAARSAPLNGSTTFTVAATGAAPLAYQWRKNGGPLPGETAASLTLSGLQDTDTADYDVVLRNVDGVATSAVAALTVVAPPPVVVTAPASASVVAGTSVNFSVNATGSGLTYRWRKNGVDIPGATSSSLPIPAAAEADGGRYDVVVSNSGGAVVSRPALLIVAAAWASPAALRYELDGAVPALNGAVADATGNTSGVLIGSAAPVATSSASPALGNAWDVSGSANAFIRVPSNPVVRSLGNITQTRGLTVAFWVKYLHESSAQNNLRVLGLTDCVDVLTGSIFGRAQLNFRFGNDANIQLIELKTPASASSSVPILDGVWRHAVATLDFAGDASNAKVYVDGALVATQSQPVQNSFANPTANLILAARASSGSTPNSQLKGAFDQFAVFTRALTAAEVAQLYTTGTIANYAPLVTAAASRPSLPWPENTCTLVASATDDAKPLPAALTYSWTQVSGPAASSLANAASALTDVTFSAPGTYVFRVTASDGALPATADVTVRVAVNAAPAVFASTPTPLVGPAATFAALSGGAVDDGVPGLLALSYAWTQVSGPASAVFAAPSAPSTAVSFPAATPGTYVFRLTVSDGELAGSTTVSVQTTANLAPVVHAVSPHAFFAWEGPSTAVPVVAQITDDGLPSSPGVTTCAWSLVEGPGSAVFANPAAASTTVSFSAPGVYRLRVTASDGALSDTEDLWVQGATATPGVRAPVSTAILSRTPEPYEHPRIFFTDADRPALQAAAASDSVASAARTSLVANVAATIDNPNHFIGAAFLRLKAGDTAFNTRAVIKAQSPTGDAMTGHASSGLYGTLAAASYLAWLEQEPGSVRLRELATALTTAAINHATWWQSDYIAGGGNGGLAPDFFSDLGFCYDLLYDSMTETQRAVVRQTLVLMTAGRYVFGAYEAEYAFSTNWRTYHQHLIHGALAIEGETGFDAAILATNRKAARNFLTKWGISSDGFNREGPGYFAFGMHNGALSAYALSRRQENFLATTHFYRSVQEFFSQMAPDNSGKMYGSNDGPGWSNGGGTSSYFPILKATYPDDPVVDLVTRHAIPTMASKQPLLMAIWGRAPLAGNTTFAAATAAQPMPLHVFSPQRGIGVARSTWNADAVQLDFDNRFDSFLLGHSHATRNHFTLYALGREWIGGHGYHYTANDLKSTVLIDGIGQSSMSLTALAAAGLPQVVKWPPLPGKFLENGDHPQLSLFAGDARPSYAHTWADQYHNDPARVIAGTIATQWRWRDLAYPGFVFPVPENGDNSWADKFIRAEATPFNPVHRAFRSVLLLRGSRPYVLVLDDIRKDDLPRTYTWTANSVTNHGLLDMTLQAGATATDAVFFHANTDTASGPRLLVRVLEAKGTAPGPIALNTTPIDFGEGLVNARRIQITRTSVVAPDFKVLLYPHQSGESLPTTAYDPATGVLTITTPDGSTDVFRLVVQPDGRTRVASFTRGGATPPTLALPADITVQNTLGPVAVNFAVTATDSANQPLVPQINPAPGYVFPVGTTPVTVSVADAAGNTATGTFNVTVQAAWTVANIGNLPVTLGSATLDLGTRVCTVTGTGGLTGSGANGDIVGGTNEGFTYVSQPWTGDGIFTARVASFTGTDANAKAGLMVRETTAAGSKNSVMFMTAGGAATFQNQVVTSGSSTTSTTSGRGLPEWIRLVRSGDTFTGFYSDDGNTWTRQGTATTNTLSGTALTVGFAVAPRTGGQTVNATFTNFSFLARPAAPTGLAASATGTQVNLAWNAVTDAATYAVKRAAVSGGPYATLAASLTAASYVDTTAPLGSVAYYIVTATNAVGEGSASAEVNATALTALQSWRLTHLGTSANTGAAADSADFDGDGASNLLEYALGTAPDSAASRPNLESQISNLKLQLTFVRARSDVTCIVEASSDLASGSWTTLATNPGIVGESVTVTDTVNLPTANPPRRFLRLRVSAP